MDVDVVLPQEGSQLSEVLQAVVLDAMAAGVGTNQLGPAAFFALLDDLLQLVLVPEKK